MFTQSDIGRKMPGTEDSLLLILKRTTSINTHIQDTRVNLYIYIKQRIPILDRHVGSLYNIKMSNI